MNKDAIKIVKRNKKDEAEKAEAAVVVTAKAESDTQNGIVNTVKNWIFERQENSRAEKDFSDSKILSWESMPENLK